MPFILRATFKDETRNITFPEDGAWPAYGDVQAKVYFSPSDGPGECKFKRHVCSAEEYDDAAATMTGTTTFPRPTLIFQVLSSTDPRLSTAQKYHQSVAYTTARSALNTERKQMTDAVTRIDVVLTALKAKRRACGAEDGVGQRFWNERLAEKTSELKRVEKKLRVVEADIQSLEKNEKSTVHKSAVEKETQRNKESKAEVFAFLEGWNKRVESGEVEISPAAFDAQKWLQEHVTPPVASPPQAHKPAKKAAPQAVKIEQLINFADPADLPLPETVAPAPAAPPAPTPRRTDNAPVQAFPSLESILNAATRTNRANPAVGTAPLPAVGRSYSVLANQLRTVGVPAVEATGEKVTNEIKNILEGFLVNLGGQLDAFEGGLKAQYSKGRQSVDSSLKKVDEAVEKVTFASNPVKVKEEKTTVSEQAEAETKIALPELVPETINMPGAFRPRSTGAAKAKEEKLSAEDELMVLTKAFRHKLKICDSCGEKPAGLCYKCDNCADFDLCSKCLPRLSTSFHAKDHTFTAIPHPVLASRLSTTKAASVQAKSSPDIAKEAHHNATCDTCHGRIKGERYKCLDCPDWDSCSNCYKGIEDIHPHHSFVIISKKEDYIMKRGNGRNVLHPRVVCDGCQNGIVGSRFKCMHPECADFDLCEACESSPRRSHPIDHPMLKMRVPQRVQNHSFFDGGNGLPQAAAGSVPPPPPPPPAPPIAPQNHHGGHHGGRRHGPWRIQEAWGSCPGAAGFAPPAFGGRGVVGCGGRPHGAFGPSGVPPFRYWQVPSGPGPYAPRPDHTGMHGGPRGRHGRRGAPFGFGEPLSHFHGAEMPVPADFEQKDESEATGCSGPIIPTFGTEEDVQSAAVISNFLRNDYVAVVDDEVSTQEVVSTGPINADLINTETPVEAESPAETETSVSFVDDVTVPDGFPLPPSAQFVKIWKLKNTGRAVISRDSVLRFVGGESFGLDVKDNATKLNADVKPGEEFNVSVSLRAPEKVGERYVGYWRLAGPDGEDFGHRLWAEINVVDAELESTLSSSSVIMPNIGGGNSEVATVTEEADEPSLNASIGEAIPKAKDPLAPLTPEVETALVSARSEEPLFSPLSNARTLDEISTTSWDDSDEEVMRVPGGMDARAHALGQNDQEEDEEDVFSDDEFELLENDSDDE